MTKQRQLILDIIRSSTDHMTAEEIFFEAKQKQTSIAVGTVYRNLGLMAEAGEIKRLSMPNAPDRFDKTILPHEHIICEHCGRLSDLPVFDLKDYIEKQTGVKILGYDLNLRYVCDDCKKIDAY